MWVKNKPNEKQEKYHCKGNNETYYVNNYRINKKLYNMI